MAFRTRKRIGPPGATITRTELFARTQADRFVDPIVDRAYKKVEEKRWREHTDDSPHGQPWHTSFHASQFPGNDPKACSRQSLYRMMDFAPPEPTSRWLRALASAGKGIENELVGTWNEAGDLISAAPDDEFQTGFQIEDVWLTGSVDAVICPRGTNKPIPIEVKTAWDRVITEMQEGRGPKPEHVSQLKVQLALVRMFQEKLWPGMELCDHGYVYYLSRDNPAETAEFRVDYDPQFFEAGLQKLKLWQKYFIDDHLPSSPFATKKHPMGWKWSYPPCKFCSVKKICKVDHEQGATSLLDSVGVPKTRQVRRGYDPHEARKRVLERWGVNPDEKV